MEGEEHPRLSSDLHTHMPVVTPTCVCTNPKQQQRAAVSLVVLSVGFVLSLPVVYFLVLDQVELYDQPRTGRRKRSACLHSKLPFCFCSLFNSSPQGKEAQFASVSAKAAHQQPLSLRVLRENSYHSKARDAQGEKQKRHSCVAASHQRSARA